MSQHSPIKRSELLVDMIQKERQLLGLRYDNSVTIIQEQFTQLIQKFQGNQSGPNNLNAWRTIAGLGFQKIIEELLREFLTEQFPLYAVCATSDLNRPQHHDLLQQITIPGANQQSLLLDIDLIIYHTTTKQVVGAFSCKTSLSEKAAIPAYTHKKLQEYHPQIPFAFITLDSKQNLQLKQSNAKLKTAQLIFIQENIPTYILRDDITSLWCFYPFSHLFLHLTEYLRQIGTPSYSNFSTPKTVIPFVPIKNSLMVPSSLSKKKLHMKHIEKIVESPH